MRDLLEKLEGALLSRNPLMANLLQAGLSDGVLRKELSRNGIDGAVEPVIRLYSWKNGATVEHRATGNQTAIDSGLVPTIEVQLSQHAKTIVGSLGSTQSSVLETYFFLPLKKAILEMKSYVDYAKPQPRLRIITGHYFPFFWNGSSKTIAVDLEAKSGDRVVVIQTDKGKDEHSLRLAYDSFEDFLKDAIRANEERKPLVCQSTPGRPIE